MKCDFCKREENEIIGIFKPIIMTFEKDIDDLDKEINDIKIQYPSKNGFTNENFEKVKKIDKNILDIKLDAIMGNMEPFIKLDINIKLLTSYFTIFKPEIKLQNTLGDLLNLFVNEPTQQRLSDEVKEIVIKRECLSKKIKIIKEKNEYIERDNINDIIIPLNIFGFEEEIISDILKIIRKTSMKRNIILCPYCNYLFKEKNIVQFNSKEVTPYPDYLKQSRGSWVPNPLEE